MSETRTPSLADSSTASRGRLLQTLAGDTAIRGVTLPELHALALNLFVSNSSTTLADDLFFREDISRAYGHTAYIVITATGIHKVCWATTDDTLQINTFKVSA